MGLTKCHSLFNLLTFLPVVIDKLLGNQMQQIGFHDAPNYLYDFKVLILYCSIFKAQNC